MLRSVKHRKLIAGLPLNRLLTETDGPFVQNEGSAIYPRDVYRAVREIALLHGISEDAARFVVLSNLKKIVTMDSLK